MNIAMACVCGSTATARSKRDTWRFGHAHRWCGTDELVARRRLKGGKPQPPPAVSGPQRSSDELAARRRRKGRA